MNGRREFVYFSDRDLGHQFPSLLRARGVAVERHDDHFGPGTPDQVWIREVANRHWVALSRDSRIRYSPLALDVLMRSGARVFVLVGKLTTIQAAEVFLAWRLVIEEMLTIESGPFIAKIRRDGVHMWLQ